MTTWTNSTIGDQCGDGFIQLQTGPFGSQLHAHEYVEVGVPVVPTEAIRNRQIDRSALPMISAAKADALSRHRLRQGDILFARRGVQATGHVAYVGRKEEGFVCGTGAIRLRVLKPGGVMPRFLSHVLAQPASIEWFKFHAIGATMPNLNEGIIRQFRFSYPSPHEQERIANVLDVFEEKIELNRRTGQTLEAIAQAIFKSWFVDSTPDAGQPSTLKDLTSKIGSGATPRGGRDVYVDEGAALIRSQNVYDSQFVWDGLARITDEAATQLANVQVQPGDVLLNITGASILRTCIVPPDVLPARVNQHVAIIRAKPGVSPHYLHLQLLQPETKAYLLGLNAGGSREAVTKAHIESVPLMDPDAERMNAFHQAVAPLFALAQSIDAENRKLASLRDELLPRLLSGELKPGVHEEADAAMIAEAAGA